MTIHRPTAILLAITATACTLADAPPAPDVLTENSAASWSAWADFASAAVFDDTSRVQVGASSLRFETTGGFDTWLWSPSGQDANWDLVAAGAGGLGFWIYAENPNIGFQNGSPWVRIYSDPNDYIELRSTHEVLNDARNQWLYMNIPFSGNAHWARTVVGSPTLASVDYIEIHADTWDAGFTLWIDGLDLTLAPPPPDRLVAYAGNAHVALAWNQYVDPTGQFDHYAVYRQTAPFTSTVGLTPLTTLSSISQTTFNDATAVNGTRYWYAVTAVFAGGGETTQVQPVGPRTPRDETDLQVVSIGRTPRYQRFDPQYTFYEVTDPSGFGPYYFTAATDLGSGQSGSTQRWPVLGEQVTYTMTVRNRGTNTWAGNIGGVWRWRGMEFTPPDEPVVLAPGQTWSGVGVTIYWDNEPGEMSFTLDVSDARPDNNELGIDFKSVAFLSYIDRTYYENFREQTPDYPNAFSDDFIDWLNNHMRRFNELFEQAGTAKRVHFDILEMLEDNAPDPSVQRIDFAIFPFRYLAGDGTLRFSGYYHADDDIDYGLLHEMGHQLGLIDIYRLNVDPSQNQVTHTGYSAIECLMNGCSTLISQHSADAMTRWHNTAQGYFGQYLYALPDTTRLRILGRDGQPLAGATVTVYQKCERPGLGEVITNQPKAQGTTNASGIYTLPNVPINPDLAPTTFAGDTLRPNPFGYIAVIGTNGVFLLKIEHNGFADYAWLDITEINDAYNAGQTSVVTIDRTVSLGGPIQHFPPADMAEQNAASWTVWAQQGSISISDATQHMVGAASVRIDTDGGFDTYARYPGDHLAIWNLSEVDAFRFWARSVNNNSPQFQGGSPWIRLGQANGYIELHPTWDILNESVGAWRLFTVPLAGDATWQRIVSGTPDLAAISHVEIHADTWGAGFNLWLDGVGFDPNPTPLVGDVDLDGHVTLTDLALLLSSFGACSGDPAFVPGADFDANGCVELYDLAVLLTNFGI